MHPIIIEDQLIDDFSEQEVKITRDLLECQELQAMPSSLRRAILLTLRGHYSNPVNYGEYYQHLSCYAYSEEGPSTLYVGYTSQNDDSKPDNIPGIYIGFGQTTYTKTGFGNFSGYTDDRSGTHLSKLSEMTLSIRHIANSADDAYDLADMTAFVLTALADPIIRKMNAMGLEVTGVGIPERKNQSPQRDYGVVTEVKISYTSSVTRSVESHRLRRIALMITT
jgi:hypothetical protein